MSERVLITGATGFIGRSTIPALLESGFDVHSVTSTEGRSGVADELRGTQRHVVDLLDASQIDALTARVEASHLLHFAWTATPGEYRMSAENFCWLEASELLVRRFRACGGERAVLAGSCAEYDWSRAGVCDELTTPLADAALDASPYALCKISMQRKLEALAAETGLSAGWGRIFFQFGPHEHPDRLVPSVIRRLLLGQEAPVSSGAQERSFLHVGDVGRAFVAFLRSDVRGAVNIGSDERMTIAQLVARIAEEIGRPQLVRYGARPVPAHEPQLLVPALRRLQMEVRWRPRFSLGEGLTDTINWWRSELCN